ncbi:hypothetical protein SZN_09271 [Streptomyces zinciresistens K42]|uniref:Uncharacterized protein n=1 Tax=Streptomyces zinciresistens K42 TaxID=700597 RepID=G2G8N6_9ACTN|nr:hypothetical protein SZN_09271 [Streptomyces zinciresistens K42]
MVTREPAGPEGRGGRWLLVVEVLFVLVAVAGLALWSVPGALLAGGVLGVLACERASADRRAAGVRAGGEAAGGERQ